MSERHAMLGEKCQLEEQRKGCIVVMDALRMLIGERCKVSAEHICAEDIFYAAKALVEQSALHEKLHRKIALLSNELGE